MTLIACLMLLVGCQGLESSSQEKKLGVCQMKKRAPSFCTYRGLTGLLATSSLQASQSGLYNLDYKIGVRVRCCYCSLAQLIARLSARSIAASLLSCGAP